MQARFSDIRVAGIATAIPDAHVSAYETASRLNLDWEEADKIVKMTGVSERRVADADTWISDLVHEAAEGLISELGWARESINALVFVSQTNDYDAPATACGLQHRLGLSKECAAFDVGLGCSGYVYGLWLCSSLIASRSANRVLLLVGDTSSKVCAPDDRSTVFLFGDAGSATALEYSKGAPSMSFVLGTDGSGREPLMFRHSGYRGRAEGPDRSTPTLYMDGGEVFAFTIREVPRLLEETLELAGWTKERIHAFVPHQANRFMLQHLAKKSKIPEEKVILSLDEYGNTSSASIPLALSHRLRERLASSATNLLIAGFGIGWSWGAATLTVGPAVMPEVMVTGSVPELAASV